MNDFDENIKKKIKKHLNNIEFSSHEKEKIKEYMNKKRNYIVKNILLTLSASLTIVLVFILMISGPTYKDNDELEMAHSFSKLRNELVKKEDLYNLFETNENDQINMDENNDKSGLSEEETNDNEENNAIFIEVLDKYLNMQNLIAEQIINFENGGNEFKRFTKKEEVYELLSEFMTYKAAEDYWSFRLKEQDNRLFLIPMDSHGYIDPNEPYVINKKSKYEYEFVQEITSDLFGRSQVTIIFKKNDQEWLIDAIKTELL